MRVISAYLNGRIWLAHRESEIIDSLQFRMAARSISDTNISHERVSFRSLREGRLGDALRTMVNVGRPENTPLRPGPWPLLIEFSKSCQPFLIYGRAALMPDKFIVSPR